MRKSLLLIGLSVVVAGCQTEPQQPFQPANQVVVKPVTVNPPDLKMNYKFSYGSDPAVKKAYDQYLKTGKAANIQTDGFVQFAYGIGEQPVIATSTFELTVISLQPGENVTNVSSGDPTRWSYSMAYSGQGKMRQAHVMVKPSQSGISTDLVITTDKRLYTLKLTTTEDGKYTRDVRFWYPQDMQNYWEQYNAEQTEKLAKDEQDTVSSNAPNISINNLNFAYDITHSTWGTPSFQPIRVFDDGTHTYIQFGSNLSSRDMPALFIQNGDKQELVNYRSKPPYFVVDKIFKKAVLVSGVGSDQVTVTIENYRF